jgi:2-hydroxy-3-keto-5-methylthiopentenyl-1-phosphate phosphatase
VLASDKVRIRPGFRELLDHCSRKGFRLVIVSNGVDFYIEAILKSLGIKGVDVFAAKSRFGPQGMKVQYIGPDGAELEVGFKEAHTEVLRSDGCSVVYIGNGLSDLYPARRAKHVFAIDDLLKRCRETNLPCVPFNDFNDVVKGLETLELD